MTTETGPAVDALAESVTGRISGPTDPSWDADRVAWNLAVDQRPCLVGRPRTASDVADIVIFAGQHGLRVAPQATGHGAGALGDLSDTILLRTDDMRDIEVDADARRVRVDAGVIWGEVGSALAPFGLVALAGSAHDVGVVGYTLGGGFSWLARKYGLAASRLRSVETVTGDGLVHRADATTDPDLFWSARGGGGTTGIVTAIEPPMTPSGCWCRCVSSVRSWTPSPRCRPSASSRSTWIRPHPPRSRRTEKQNALVNQGWRVLRFTWLDLTERPDRVVAQVRRAMITVSG